MEVKIYGAFRSGTNYVKALLELNHEVWVRSWNGGFKHAPIPTLFDDSGWAKPEVPILGVVKDPWSWLPSLWHYLDGPGRINAECASSWEKFLRSPLSIFPGASPGAPHHWYRTPIDYWTAMAKSFLFSEATVVKYEDVLWNPEPFCEEIASNLGLVRSSPDFIVPDRVMARGGDRRSPHLDDYVTDQPFDRDRYSLRGYLDEYSTDDIDLVSGLLVEDLLDELGYSAAVKP